jgi:hypothetical protein
VKGRLGTSNCGIRDVELFNTTASDKPDAPLPRLSHRANHICIQDFDGHRHLLQPAIHTYWLRKCLSLDKPDQRKQFCQRDRKSDIA